MLRRPALVLAVVAAAALAACSSSDGRSLPPPDSGQTTTSVSTPVVGQPSTSGGVSEVFSLGSPAFSEGGVIPPQHTCKGVDSSPPLTWTAAPPAAELALVVRDRNADGFVHWVVTGIDPAVQGIGEGGVPEGAVEAANSTGGLGWFGPCPPAGSGVHTYDFVLHALAGPLSLAPDLAAADAAQQVERASVGQAALSGTAAATG